MITKYITSADGTQIAVRLDGDEKRPGWLSIAPWATVETPADVVGFDPHARFRSRRFRISYDKRGTGASQRDVTDVGLEAQLADVEAIMDALSIDSCDFTAYFEGSHVAIAYAARHPERVRRLVLWQPYADGRDFMSAERVQLLIGIARSDWQLATRTLANLWVPRGPVDVQRTMARGFRERLSPDVMVGYLEQHLTVDVRDDAKRVAAETLVMHPAGAGVPGQPPQEVAALIPNAVFQRVDQTIPFVGTEAVAGRMMDFLDGTSTGTAESDLASLAATTIILFADIADSTELTERMGDAAFRERARALDIALRGIVANAGGTPIDWKALGDGVLATFPAAAQAIDAAMRCASAGDDVELPLHLGIHAGDVIREENNIFGGAVNIAARISALAGRGEVLVSRTVADLGRTSAGVTFEDRGEHALKGMAEPQWVFAVVPKS